MRIALLAFTASVLTATAACGAYSFPGSTTAPGTVSGSVRVYPCGPVEQQGQVCKGLVGTGLVLTFTAGSGTADAPADENGNYSIRLSAGTYKVAVKGIARIIEGPNPITVGAGANVVADYTVDSGIRAPLPPGPATTAP